MEKILTFFYTVCAPKTNIKHKITILKLHMIWYVQNIMNIRVPHMRTSSLNDAGSVADSLTLTRINSSTTSLASGNKAISSALYGYKDRTISVASYTVNVAVIQIRDKYVYGIF